MVAALAVVGLAPVAAAQPAHTPPAGTPPVAAQPAQPARPVLTVQAADGFTDVTGGVHKPAIDALAGRGVFDGTECAEDMFCPGDEMKRWTVAVWLVRVLTEAEPAPVAESSFADVDVGNRWLPHIERLAELEVTKGCRTDPLRYCPDRSATRAQVATFLVRAFDLEPADPAGFGDTAGNTHQASIDALAAARITAGCRSDPLRYCPDRPVTRAQMATFLARALGLVEKPAPLDPDVPATGTTADPADPTTDDPATDDSGTDDPATTTPSATTPADPSACRPRGTPNTTAGFPLPGWAAPPTGTIRVAVLFLDFPDVQATYSTEVEAAHGLPYAEEYLETASYGRIDVEFVPLHGWLQAPRRTDAYLVGTIIGERHVRLGTEAVQLADPRFDFTGIDIVMTVLPSAHFNGGDHTFTSAPTDEGVVGSMAQVNTAPHPDRGEPEQWGITAAHEVAHGLGLTDLYPYDASRHELPEAPRGRIWVRSGFGLMGLEANFLARPDDGRLAITGRGTSGQRVTGHTFYLDAAEMLAWSRWQLGWLDESQVLCLGADGSRVTLRPVADPGDAAVMAAVPLSDTEVLVVEVRVKVGYEVTHRCGTDSLEIRAGGRVAATHRLAVAGAHRTVRLAEHTQALRAAVLAAFDTAGPCRRKANRPPSPQAAAIAARLNGTVTADPVIDLDIYRRLTQGEAS